jgi:tRNA G10  N-methylase Trm11
MIPSLARRIVEEYSKAGDLVLDPMCGIGTTLAEAAAAWRRTIGIELEPRWVVLAEENLDHVLPENQRPLAQVRTGNARSLPRLLGDVAGTIDLVCTSPPTAWDTPTLGKTRCGTGRSPNLGRARGDSYQVAMVEIYAGCLEVLRPGGMLVVVTKNTRRKGGMLDRAGETVSLTRTLGFTYLQHVIALHAAIRDDSLGARPSFGQRTAIRREIERGEPAHLVVHEDVTVLRKPEAESEALNDH